MRKLFIILFLLFLSSPAFSAQGVRGRDDNNLDERLATEAGQGNLNPNGNTIVSTCLDRFRDEFPTFDTTNNWTVIQQGTDHNIYVSGTANGSRYLAIESGATADQETIILSKETFTMPFQVTAGLSTSARNTDFQYFFEVVEVDSNGDVVTDTSIYPAPNCNDARNCASFMTATGTTASLWRYNFRTSGVSEKTSNNTTFISTTPSGTTPDFIQTGNFTITANGDYVRWQGQSIDALSMGANAKITQSSLDPTKTYAIRFRFKNTGTTPRTFRIHTVKVRDFAEVSVNFRNIAGTLDMQDAAPVNVTNADLATGTKQDTGNSQLAVINANTSTVARAVSPAYLDGSAMAVSGDGYEPNHSTKAVRKMQTQWVQNYEVDETTATLDIDETTDARDYPLAQFDAINFIIKNNDATYPVDIEILYYNKTTPQYELAWSWRIAASSTLSLYEKFMPTYVGDWNDDDGRYGYIVLTTVGGTLNYDAKINFTFTPINLKL